MAPIRIIFTGCRDWTDRWAIERVLIGLKSTWKNRRTDEIVIVHGACPTGADAIAAEEAKLHGFTIEPHPADWAKHGKAAGPIRNGEMVKLGAARAYAFWDGKSRGTYDMIRQCTTAGISLHIHPRRDAPTAPPPTSPPLPPAPR